MSHMPNKLDKSKLSLGILEQVAREVRKQRSYKALRRERAYPATRRGLMGVTWGKYVEGWGARGVSAPPGPPITLTRSSS